MSKITHEYNEDVIGYVVNFGDGRSCNFQFDKVFSNHPQPKYKLFSGCEGDETHEKFSEIELDEMDKYLSRQKDVQKIVDAFNVAIYENSNFSEKTAPIFDWEILEAANMD